MSPLIASLRELSSAEEILRCFDVPFEPRQVEVHRLHILKRFSQYLTQANGLEGLDAQAARHTARQLLCRAYDDFVGSSAQEQKVFPVFQQAVHRISLDGLRRAGARA